MLCYGMCACICVCVHACMYVCIHFLLFYFSNCQSNEIENTSYCKFTNVFLEYAVFISCKTTYLKLIRKSKVHFYFLKQACLLKVKFCTLIFIKFALVSLSDTTTETEPP